MKAGESNWHDDHVEAMKGLLAKGLSASQVAVALNDRFDTFYSRNAVIGKKIRLGIRDTATSIRLKNLSSLEKARSAPRRLLPPKPAPQPRTEKPRPKPTQFICSEITGLREAEVIPLNLGLIDLSSDQCRWPYGDGPFVFCGCEVFGDSSYCEPHLSLSQGRGTIGEQIALKLPRSIIG